MSELDNEQLSTFGISCIERTLGLYKSVDLHEDISLADASLAKGTAYKELLLIVDFVKNDAVNSTPTQISDQIQKCDPLILDVEDIFDNSTRNEVASMVAQSVDYLLNFRLEDDGEFIQYCSENNLEILNQLKSDEYCTKINPEASNDEIDTYLNPIFEHELIVQIKIVEAIMENRVGDLEVLVSENPIS